MRKREGVPILFSYISIQKNTMNFIYVVLGIAFSTAIFILKRKEEGKDSKVNKLPEEAFNFLDVEPLYLLYKSGEVPTDAQIDYYASSRETRSLCYELVQQFEGSNTRESSFFDKESVYESYAARFLYYDLDYDAYPDVISYVETLPIRNGKEALVFAFKNEERHPYASDRFLYLYVLVDTTSPILKKPLRIHSDFSMDKLSKSKLQGLLF